MGTRVPENTGVPLITSGPMLTGLQRMRFNVYEPGFTSKNEGAKPEVYLTVACVQP